MMKTSFQESLSSSQTRGIRSSHPRQSLRSTIDEECFRSVRNEPRKAIHRNFERCQHVMIHIKFHQYFNSILLFLFGN